jgi:hypothetical protein
MESSDTIDSRARRRLAQDELLFFFLAPAIRGWNPTGTGFPSWELS